MKHSRKSAGKPRDGSQGRMNEGIPVFLWRSLRPDALTVLLDYLARRGKAPASTDPASARPLAGDSHPERPEPASR